MRIESNNPKGAVCPASGCPCTICKAVNFEERRSRKSEWKTATQLYGAESHYYYFYQLQLQNTVTAAKDRKTI